MSWCSFLRRSERSVSESDCVFFNDTATTEIYTLSLHDALPIWAHTTSSRSRSRPTGWCSWRSAPLRRPGSSARCAICAPRSEEHTSELQSRQYLVCRLLLEKKKTPSKRSLSTLDY